MNISHEYYLQDFSYTCPNLTCASQLHFADEFVLKKSEVLNFTEVLVCTMYQLSSFIFHLLCIQIAQISIP